MAGPPCAGGDRQLPREFVAARTLLEQCQGLADPTHRAVGAGLSYDPYAMLLAQLAVTLMHLGYIDQARVRLNEAILEARRLRQALTLPNVLYRGTWIESIIRSTKIQQYADEDLVLSTEHGFSAIFGLGHSIARMGSCDSRASTGRPCAAHAGTDCSTCYRGCYRYAATVYLARRGACFARAAG